jgi:hypothetical protein
VAKGIGIMFLYRISSRQPIQFEALEPRTMFDANPAIPTNQFIRQVDSAAVETFRATERDTLSFLYFPEGGAGHRFTFIQSATRNGALVYWSPDPSKIDWSDSQGKSEAEGLVNFRAWGLDDGVYTLTLTWRRDDGLFGQASISGVIENVAPEIAVYGSDSATTGETVSFKAQPPIEGGYTMFNDTDADYAAGLTYHVDWDDDGVVDEHFHQPEWNDGAGPFYGYYNAFSTIPHRYNRPGTYIVHVTAEDKDGGVSNVATHQIVITGPDLTPHASDTAIAPTEPQEDSQTDTLVRIITPPPSATFATTPFAQTAPFDLDQLTQAA